MKNIIVISGTSHAKEIFYTHLRDRKLRFQAINILQPIETFLSLFGVNKNEPDNFYPVFQDIQKLLMVRGIDFSCYINDVIENTEDGYLLVLESVDEGLRKALEEDYGSFSLKLVSKETQPSENGYDYILNYNDIDSCTKLDRVLNIIQKEIV